MNPELQKWFEQAQRALEAGADAAAVNRRIAELTGGEYSDLGGLRRAALEAKAHALRPTPQRTGDEALQMAQGATLDWFDELAGVVGGVGAAVVPGGRGFSEGRQAATDAVRGRTEEADSRGGAIRNRIAGGLLTTGLGTAAAKSVGLAGNLLSGGPLTTPTRAMIRMAARGGASGAALGATGAAGAAEGGVRERLPEAAFGAGVGGLLGAATSGVLGAAQQIPRAFRKAETIGADVAGHLRNLTGRGQTPPSLLRAQQVGEQRAARQGLIQPLEAQPAPAAVTNAFVDGGGTPEVARTLQAELRAIRARNPNARQVLQEIGEVQAGKREAVETAISFSTADELVRSMDKRAKAALKFGRAEEANNLIAAYDELDTHLRTLPGYEEFKGVWARTSSNMRALKQGYTKLAQPSQSADDVREALTKLPSDEARAMALEGMVSRYATRLETKTGKSGDIARIIHAGPDFERKLRQMFPDDASFAEFNRMVDLEAASVSFAERARVVGGALAFLIGGTSLLGRLIPAPGQ